MEAGGDGFGQMGFASLYPSYTLGGGQPGLSPVLLQRPDKRRIHQGQSVQPGHQPAGRDPVPAWNGIAHIQANAGPLAAVRTGPSGRAPRWAGMPGASAPAFFVDRIGGVSLCSAILGQTGRTGGCSFRRLATLRNRASKVARWMQCPACARCRASEKSIPWR